MLQVSVFLGQIPNVSSTKRKIQMKFHSKLTEQVAKKHDFNESSGQLANKKGRNLFEHLRPERCKSNHVNFVDIVKSFPTSI